MNRHYLPSATRIEKVVSPLVLVGRGNGKNVYLNYFSVVVCTFANYYGGFGNCP